MLHLWLHPMQSLIPLASLITPDTPDQLDKLSQVAFDAF